MKTAFSLLVAGVLLTPSAQAALPWCGFQVGVQAGHSSFDVTRRAEEVWGTGFTTREVAASGTEFGLFVGYQMPVGPVWLGLQAEYALSGAEENTDTEAGDLSRLAFKKNHGVAFRVGYALNRNVLVFARLGWEATQAEFSHHDPDPPSTSAAATRTLNGRCFGLGADLAVSERVSLRLEYTWTKFSTLKTTEMIDDWEMEYANWSIKPVNSRFRIAAAYRF